MTREIASHISFGSSSVVPGRHNNRDVLLDNWVGQIGEAVGHYCLFGHIEGYLKNREALKGKHISDGGSDVLGMNIDFKASLRRNPVKKVESYHLWVRPNDYHEDTTYVLIIVEPNEQIRLTTNKPTKAHVVGWAHSLDLIGRDWEGLIYEPASLRPLTDLIFSLPQGTRIGDR